ncbi:MAG: two-component sensor histidine kinase [Proteobacteria bacterium]|nr:MAG: two-component sensor histidine kinase [Pseudomonadota bacterium]PIE40217.1 MAG: two-component sensor histidine kinase [Gammaproteobacteria bacterium]
MSFVQGLSVNNLFVRVFGGLLLSLIVVGLFCCLLFSSLNKVRLEHHAIEVASPVLDWMVRIPENRLPYRFSVITPNNVQLGLAPIDETRLSSVLMERLTWGQTLVLTRPGLYGSHVFKMYNQEKWIVGFFPDLYSDMAESAFNMVSYELNNLSGRSLHEVISEIRKTTGLKVEVLQDIADLPGEELLSDLADFQRAWYRPDKSEPAVFYLVSESGELVRLEFVKPFSPVAWPIMLFLAIASIGMLAATVYWLLQALSGRLRNLETVASRIARGELEARVKTQKLDALGRLGESFNSMADHIQRLVLVQREMIHAVSHELRTPVARIRFGVQMIEDCPDPVTMEKQLKGIDNDIQELDELIDEILTYARLEQGGPIFDFQESDIVNIVTQVVSEQGGVRPDLKISADFVGNSKKWRLSEIEPRYIHRAIQNLVGNATRYCKSTVQVNCHFDNDTCRVDVEDDGAGIPESDWDTVFTPFARLDDSRTRTSGGYGLGLSIVRRILYWHGGQAMLGRSVLGGAKFSLVWPRTQQTSEKSKNSIRS